MWFSPETSKPMNLVPKETDNPKDTGFHLENHHANEHRASPTPNISPNIANLVDYKVISFSFSDQLQIILSFGDR